MPIEDPRNLREVGIFLRAIDEKLDKAIAIQEKQSTRKVDLVSTILASVVSASLVGLIFWVVNNSVQIG